MILCIPVGNHPSRSEDTLVDQSGEQAVLDQLESDKPEPSASSVVEDDNCALCQQLLSSEEVEHLPCGHLFHKQCIEDYVQSKPQPGPRAAACPHRRCQQIAQQMSEGVFDVLIEGGGEPISGGVDGEAAPAATTLIASDSEKEEEDTKDAATASDQAATGDAPAGGAAASVLEALTQADQDIEEFR